MTKIKKLKCRNYSIIVGKNAFENISKYVNFNKYSQVILISEEKIYNLWKEKIDSILKTKNKILLSSGERTKDIKTTEFIFEKLVQFCADRKTLIVNIGGGMITDLGGFSASIYMRGVDYVNIPTSLLAIVDASIGGKNGVNVNKIKNIVGCFNEPKLVIIDANFLQTLPKRELNSAYGEIIKHSIIGSSKYFNLLANEDLTNQNIDEIILNSIKIKKHFVEKDFKEKGIRKILNFGHTIGHAIETISQQLDEPFLHGECVLLGIFFETKIAEKKGILSNKNSNKIYKCLNKYGISDLFEKVKKNIEIFNETQLLGIIKKDKKNQNGIIKMVLPIKIGKCKYDILIKENEIKNVFKNA